MILLFDIGGTSTRLAVSQNGKKFEKPRIIPTPKDFSKAMSQIERIAKELSKGRKIRRVVGGVAGVMDKERTKLVGSGHVRWKNKPLQRELERRLKTPVVIENDTALVGLGEAVRGAGKGYGIVVYVTVSTGVGGVKIVRGKIAENAMGFEPGHQIIDYRNPKKVLQDFVSGAALQKRYRKDPAEIKDPKVFKNLAWYLGVGLANSILHWSPEVVVLGGPLITKHSGFLKQTERYLKKVLVFPSAPKLKLAKLGDVGGLYGALELAKQHG